MMKLFEFKNGHNVTKVAVLLDANVGEETIGMNLSTAFNILVRQSLREGRIPFDITLSQPRNHFCHAGSGKDCERPIG